MSQIPGNGLGKVSMYVLSCVGIFLYIIYSIYYFGCQRILYSALSSVHFVRFTFPEGFFSSHVLLSQPTIFVLGLVAKCTVIGLQEHMMKILRSASPLHH